MGTEASQITSLTIVYTTVYSDADQSKHQTSASLAFVRGIHRGPVNSPHKGPVTRKMFPFDDVIMTHAAMWSAIHPVARKYQMVPIIYKNWSRISSAAEGSVTFQCYTINVVSNAKKLFTNALKLPHAQSRPFSSISQCIKWTIFFCFTSCFQLWLLSLFPPISWCMQMTCPGMH